jgi:hypothetical protein
VPPPATQHLLCAFACRPAVIKTTVVLVCEVCKVGLSLPHPVPTRQHAHSRLLASGHLDSANWPRFASSLLNGAFCALQIVCALGILVLQGPLAPRFAGWSVSDAFLASALPAGIYAVQNVLVQGAYPHLDSLTLTMLNQTKLLFTALFTALILGSAPRPPLSTPHLRPPGDQAVACRLLVPPAPCRPGAWPSALSMLRAGGPFVLLRTASH